MPEELVLHVVLVDSAISASVAELTLIKGYAEGWEKKILKE